MTDMTDIRGTGRYFIFITLFFTGAAIMVLELLGTRVLGPYYGTSLYVWSSLITVTLVALSIGYWMGGRIADRSLEEDGKKPDVKNVKLAADRLYHFILLAGVFVMIIPFIAPTVLKATGGMGIKAGALASAAILFTAPLVILGMVTPYAIKLLTGKLKVVGATAGNLFSISTVGSVAGSLMTGFVLIPNIGTKKILYLQSGLLVGLFVVWILLSKRYGLAVMVLPLLAACITGATASTRNAEAQGFKVVDQRESFYGHLKVIDKGKKRWLSIDGSGHTGIRKDTGLSLNPYAYYLEIMNFMRPEAKDALVIGMGGGSVSKRFEQTYGLSVDSVEINSRVVDLAREYFGFDSQREKVHIQDGRTFVLNSGKKYDFVIMDAFVGGDSPPIHLLTVESLEEIKAVLKPDGIVALNTLAFHEGKGRIIAESINKTFMDKFKHVSAFKTEKKSDFGNVIFLASGEDLSIRRSIDTCDIEGVCQLFREMLENEADYSAESGILLTDDYNPLELWSVRTSEALRRNIMSFIPGEVLSL